MRSCSSNYKTELFRRIVQAQFLNLARQCVPTDTKQGRGINAPSVGMLQCLQDQGTLKLCCQSIHDALVSALQCKRSLLRQCRKLATRPV